MVLAAAACAGACAEAAGAKAVAGTGICCRTSAERSAKAYGQVTAAFAVRRTFARVDMAPSSTAAAAVEAVVEAVVIAIVVAKSMGKSWRRTQVARGETMKPSR